MQQLTEKRDSIRESRAADGLGEMSMQVVYTASFGEAIGMTLLSDKAADLTGYEREQILAGEPAWLEIVHEDDRKRYVETFDRCRQQGQPVELGYRIVTKDGNTRQVFDTAEPVIDGEGNATAIVGTVADVTDHSNAMRELERSQLLQNLGKLVAGIAHEINTPIQFIGDNMTFLSDSFQEALGLLEQYRQLVDALVKDDLEDKPWREQIEKILAAQAATDLDFITAEAPLAVEQSLEGVRRVATIVAAMRDFSHIDERRMAPADLNKAMQNTLVILRNEIKYVADVRTDLDQNLPMVVCCVDDINQVFLNLLINATHSIEDAIAEPGGKRGVITVTTTAEGDNVIISIADTGTGISPEVQARMFEPFFTTKSANKKGTGQGLSAAKRIVEDKHKGSLDCETEPGCGTTFTVRLAIDGIQQQKP
jgi:PAS domain S-box-containing protein